jgi:hypothetical protein
VRRLKLAAPSQCRADLARAVASWREWLTSERRASPHTLSAYGRDLAAFLDFLAEHLGQGVVDRIPSLEDAAILGKEDKMRTEKSEHRAKKHRKLGRKGSLGGIPLKLGDAVLLPRGRRRISYWVVALASPR